MSVCLTSVYTAFLLSTYIAENAVVAIFWNNTDGGEHPIHLHGHPFFLLETSENAPGTAAKYAPRYLRRDVGTILADGWAKYIFVADYASVLMIHCHIGEVLRTGSIIVAYFQLVWVSCAIFASCVVLHPS